MLYHSGSCGTRGDGSVPWPGQYESDIHSMESGFRTLFFCTSLSYYKVMFEWCSVIYKIGKHSFVWIPTFCNQLQVNIKLTISVVFYLFRGILISLPENDDEYFFTNYRTSSLLKLFVKTSRRVNNLQLLQDLYQCKFYTHGTHVPLPSIFSQSAVGVSVGCS